MPTVPAQTREPLRRSRRAQLAGVCEGTARHLGWSPLSVRVAFAALTLISGAGVLLYAWLWALVSIGDAADAHDQRITRRIPAAWIGTSAAAALAALTLALLGWHGRPYWFTTTLLAAALAVAASLWAGLLDASDTDRGPRHATIVRLVNTGVLVVLILALAAVASRPATGSAALVAALIAMVAIVAVHAPLLITRFRELSEDRVRRIREEQRSSMAAHLHDSVLQTLALIQNRAGASSEVARIARAQERELRGWLYDGDEPADSDLLTDLRDYAAALELDYAVHIEVVAAGASLERASSDIAAAAREAMLNTARHAGGDVSVYIENRSDAVEVFIRDRGPGFSLADVPDDRLGVRQSVIGRMQRAGGTALVRPGAGGAGTEVRLRLPRPQPEQETP